ncbi:SagB/ThcOx family dehydrogenase [Nocardia sp. NPDC058518]|uniref:SagB/ThcOx family dehydrogenase n=1 Tax=Nocardia sp. NPDC058518 TaxID=3346534 RepID=UPI00364B2429
MLIEEIELGGSEVGEQPILQQLSKYGFTVDSSEVDSETVPEVWRLWGTAAWAFHSATLDAPFIGKTTGEADERFDQYLSDLGERERPTAPTATEIRGDEIYLPRVTPRTQVEYFEVVEDRRTHRRFDDAPVSLRAFSVLMQKTFGPVWFSHANNMGMVQLRGAASGGARHDTVPYVYIDNVVGIPRGVYEYDELLHAIRPLPCQIDNGKIVDIIYGQNIIDKAAFVIFLTSRVDRLHWKYPHPRAMRVMYQNSGCIAQLFSMNATALGLGGSMTGAFQDTLLSDLLSLDRDCEIPVFIMGCGIPRLRDDGLPLRHSHHAGEVSMNGR